jgi:hypothetical protein
MATNIGFVTLICSSPEVTLKLRLSEERPTVTAGYGGWEEVERPRRVGVVTWKGSPVRRLTLGVIFYHPNNGTLVENEISRLESLARPREGGTPPSIRIDAPGRHVPLQAVTWVIDAIDWGDADMNPGGNRTKQHATVSLIEYLSDQLVEEDAPANKRRARSARKSGKNRKRGAKAKRHPAKRGKKSKAARRATASPAFEGEHLASLAARELGDARRWREIAELNDIRDPRAVHIGQVLRLP